MEPLAKKKERGVALLLALLVTTVLIALVFEFAYGTRVSTRAAANFRDRERAYFMARAGVNFVGKLLADDLKQGRLQANLQQRDWIVVPLVSGGDTELRVRWEDEAGKINLSSTDPIRRLFDVTGVSQDTAERMAERVKERGRFYLVSELYEVMNEEEYDKTRRFVTTFTEPGARISINTAPVEVLQALFRSLGKDDGLATMIDRAREVDLFNSSTEISEFPNIDTLTAGKLVETSDVFRVYSYATVGEYTRQVEAVIRRTSGGFTILSWRSL